MTTEIRSLWSHPTLDLFPGPAEAEPQKAKLYLLPSTFGEEYDSDDMPQPTSASDLPDLHKWISGLAVSVIEVWAGKRQPAQLATRCHRVIYLELLRRVGKIPANSRLKSIYLSQPLDGICEAAVTIAIGDRNRAMVIRCEGVDGRWLCTNLALL